MAGSKGHENSLKVLANPWHDLYFLPLRADLVCAVEHARMAWQVTLDMLTATDAPVGHGHVYAPAH